MRTVSEQHTEAFTAGLPAIIEQAAAAGATPDDFARTLNRAARALENDDGESRYEQQRRDTALRTWTEKRNGMFRIADPPVEDRNGDLSTPTTSRHDDRGGDNDDDDDNDEWSALYAGGPSRLGRPEIVIVLDARQQTVEANDGAVVVDWGIPVELPAKGRAELFPRADIRPVIIANGVVVHAPGEMNLGRTTRLASRAQRRALRAMYRPAPWPVVAWRSSSRNRTMCTTGNTAARPISTSSSRSAASTTTAHTKVAGVSPCNRTAPSPSRPRRHRPDHRATPPAPRRLSVHHAKLILLTNDLRRAATPFLDNQTGGLPTGRDATRPGAEASPLHRRSRMIAAPTVGAC